MDFDAVREAYVISDGEMIYSFDMARHSIAMNTKEREANCLAILMWTVSCIHAVVERDLNFWAADLY